MPVVADVVAMYASRRAEWRAVDVGDAQFTEVGDDLPCILECKVG